MAEQSITVETPDGAMELYEATPDGDAAGRSSSSRRRSASTTTSKA